VSHARYQDLVFAAMVTLLCVIVGIGSSAAAGPNSPVPAVNAKEGVGLKDYDPVAYFVNGQPTKGAERYSFAWKGVTYLFASEENLKRFKADSEKYLPQYGGYCAYAMSLNRIADADPASLGDRREHADVGLVVLRGGPQDRHITRQVGLRMGGHHTADRRAHPVYFHRFANFEHPVEPAIFDEAVGLGAGVHQDVGAKPARVKVRIGFQRAQMRDGAARDYVD